MSFQKHLRSNIANEIMLYSKTEDMLDAFLEDILTPSEIMAIDERLSIIRLLGQGLSQREIAEKLGISVTTVSRGSKILQYGRLKDGWR